MMNVSQLWQGRHVIVLGLGISGQSAARFLLKRGAKVVGIDSSREVLEQPRIKELSENGMRVFHESLFREMDSFECMIISPGISSTHPLYCEAKKLGLEVIGEVELACRSLSKPCLGITGTNGKTTTTLLTTHILNSAGKKAFALGNIGNPLTAALDDETCQHADIYVIELSSFQLETFQCRCMDAGVILNITPDHLDRYGTMEKYALAKIGLKHTLKHGKRLIVEGACLQAFRPFFEEGQFFSYGYSKECTLYTDMHTVYMEGDPIFSLPLSYQNKRSHDVENMMASFILCKEMGINVEQFLAGFQSFQKPAHRIEFVRRRAGVTFYDDSKGTNIDAVIRAVESIKGPIILIAGGIDKGAPYSPWINAFEGKVKMIYAIGQSSVKIRDELQPHFSVWCCQTLEEAVKLAAKEAHEGDTVLLSPGCSSYDMFKDYVHRGQEFQRIVNAL